MLTQTITLSRRELFDLVWAKPVTQVAADLGISDVGLGKICSRHDVPRPGRGYWACRQAGQAVPPPRFRKARKPELETVVISGTLRHANEARAQAKLAVSAAEDPPSAKDAPIEVHSLFAKAAKQLRTSVRSNDGLIHTVGPTSCGLAFSPDQIERALSFLTGLLLALKPLGISGEARERSLALQTEVGPLECRLVEEFKTIDYVPSEKEQAREERRLELLEDRTLYARLSLRDQSALHTPTYRNTVTAPSQQLTFKLECYDEGLRKIWRDGKRHRLEDFLPQIVAGILAIVAHRKEAQVRRLAEEAARAERARLDELARKRAEREAARLALLRDELSRAAEISGVAAWLTAMGGSDSAPVERLAKWAKGRLAELEAESTPSAVAERIGRLELFPEPDPLASSDPIRP